MPGATTVGRPQVTIKRRELMGRKALPIEIKKRRGTLRGDRMPAQGMTEIAIVPLGEDHPEPPSHLEPAGRAFWMSASGAGVWLWAGIDYTLLTMTAELLDEREALRDIVQEDPENTRLRAALRALDKQVVTQLSLLGFTPSDRARLGLVQAKQQVKIEELKDRREDRDQRGSEKQERLDMLKRGDLSGF